MLSSLIVVLFFFVMLCRSPSFLFFFFNDTATTEIYTLSLHDALPILNTLPKRLLPTMTGAGHAGLEAPQDRKSTRLNSSHGYISYAVFCLKKKKHMSSRRSLRFSSHTVSRQLDDTQC